MSLVTEEAATKYAKEFNIVNNIAENFVLNDAVVQAAPGEGRGIGFGASPKGIITFSVPEELAAEQEGSYRSSAEEHATKFADVFNSSLVTQGPDGKPFPMTMQPLAYAEGSQVHIDLGGLRKLLSEHTVADQLPDVSARYSVQYMSEKAASNAQKYVQNTLAERKFTKQQAAMENKILTACEQVIEDPSAIKDIMTKDPRTSAGVRATLQQITQTAATAMEQPEVLEQVRGENERFAGLVEKVMEKMKEKGAEKEAPATEKASSFADRVTSGDLAPKTGDLGRG